MSYLVTEAQVEPQRIAAVRRTVPIREIPEACTPALDAVWAFLVAHPDLTPGQNLFLYRHCERPEDGMEIDFGAQVAQSFEDVGEVACRQVPAGRVAMTTHVGPYAQLSMAHKAIHAWCASEGRCIGGWSWEIYGDWTPDPDKLETTVVYLLA